MRHYAKTFSVIIFCAGIIFLGSCSKQGASDKDVAKAASDAPAKKPAPAASTQPAEADSTTASNQQQAATVSPNNQRYVRVATINGIDANNEFQRNVDLVQAQRRLAINLNDQISLATSSETRAALQEQYDQAFAKLNENNRKMLKTYGYSLNRNYVRVIDKSQIFMSVSDEEAAKFEANRQRRQEEESRKAE